MLGFFFFKPRFADTICDHRADNTNLQNDSQLTLLKKTNVGYGTCKRSWNKANECEHMGKDIRAEDSYGL